MNRGMSMTTRVRDMQSYTTLIHTCKASNETLRRCSNAMRAQPGVNAKGHLMIGSPSHLEKRIATLE